MDSMRGLRHFIQIVRHGSYSAAAAALQMSTPALSQSISGLEKRLGLQLFVRTTRTLHLTGDGQQLFERLAPLFDSIDTTVREVGHASQEPVGHIRLSTVTAFGKHCIVPLLPEFFSLHPGIDLTVSFHDGGRGMSRQPYDVRIHWGERPEQGKVAQHLCRMPLILVGSPEYLARHGTPRTPRDLDRHECIATANQNGSRSRWIFIKRSRRKSGQQPERIEIHPRGRLSVTDELDAVVEAAKAGLGLTVMSADCILEELQRGRLVRLMPSYELEGNHREDAEIIIQYPSRKLISPKVAVLVDFLLDKLKGRDPFEIVANT